MPGANPPLLWVAALLALLMALRLRMRAQRQSGPSSGERPPWPIVAGLALPLPPPWSRPLERHGTEIALVRAGLDRHLSVARLARARLGLALLCAAASLPLVVAAPALAPLLALALATGLLLPGAAVTLRARRRGEAVAGELPDLLDLLAICVGAGMAVDPALELGARRLGGVLGEEIERLLDELRLGTPRRSAYRNLAERVETPAVAAVVGALLQAEELGAPLSQTLAAQAAGLRADRRQWARDRAAAAAPKIQLVVALLMVPAVLALVLGVMAIEFARQVGVVMGGG